MNLSIHTTESGDMITAHVKYSTMAGCENATLSGRIAYALYDGLLWAAFNRKLSAFLASVVPTVRLQGGLGSIANAITIGERLELYVITAPWHNADAKATERIEATIAKHLPELAPLTTARPDLAAEHADLVALFAVIQDRTAHQGDAGHALAGLLNPPAKAA